MREVEQHVRALGRLREKRVREAVHMNAMHGPHALRPVPGERDPVPAAHVVAGPGSEARAHLEAGGVDDAVDLVLPAGGDHTGPGDPLHALAVAVHQVRARLVVGVQVLVVEARTFAEPAVPGLQPLRRHRIGDHRVHPAADLLHLLEVGVLRDLRDGPVGSVRRRQRGDPGADTTGDRGPVVPYQVRLYRAAQYVGGPVLYPAPLPAGRGDRREPVRVDRAIVPHVDRGRRSLEHIEFAARPRQVRDALDRGGARSDDRDPLVR